MSPTGTWSHEDIRIITNQDFGSNTYLVKTGTGNGCVVVDPGLDREAISGAIDDSAWVPEAVLCTHGHFDHIGGAAWLQKSFRIPVWLPAKDLKIAKQSNFLMAAFKLERRIELPEFHLVDTGTPPIDYGNCTFVFHDLPGHTPGSAGIAMGDLIFSGDSLYAKRTALSRLPGEDHALLRKSLAQLFTWVRGHTRILPGHGGSATIDEILLYNDALRAFMAGAN